MIDPVVEVVLLTLARSAPSIFSVIADALKGGDTPEQAIAKAKAGELLPLYLISGERHGDREGPRPAREDAEAVTPPAFVPYGAWVDSPPFEVLKVAWWQEFKGLGFSTAAIMVETFRDGLDERWEDDQIAHAGVLARQHDIELVLTFMPEPRRDYLVEYERRAPVLCELSVAAGLDSDLEGNWLPRLVEGFRDLTEAGVELVRIQRTFSRKLDIRLEADTFPFHGENSAQARVAPYVDRVYPQSNATLAASATATAACSAAVSRSIARLSWPRVIAR